MAPATMTSPKNGNGEQTKLAPNIGPLATLLKYTQDPETKRRMSEMLGKHAGAFLNSIINVVKNNKALTDVARENPASIMSAAMIAASVNLPIDPALGFAAIVPYKNRDGATAQFQLMYKGLIQLAQRTGMYKTMNEAVVYTDELASYNPITGELKFTPQENWKLRYSSDPKLDDVAGFYFRFELKTGFEMARFISLKEAMSHGKRFSKSYQADIKYSKATSLWSTMPLVMGLKTIIKMTLSKYGILSIEMQDALIADGDDFSPDTPQHVDSTIVEPENVGGMEGLKARMMQQEKPSDNEDGATGEGGASQDQMEPAAEPSPSAQEGPQADPTPSAEEKPSDASAVTTVTTEIGATTASTSDPSKPKTNSKTSYICNDADCGQTFDKPNKAKGGTLVCPHCAGTNFAPMTGGTQQDVDPNAFDNPPAADVQTETGGVVTCQFGHVVNRADLVKSAVVGNNGLGLCPTCKANGRNTIVKK